MFSFGKQKKSKKGQQSEGERRDISKWPRTRENYRDAKQLYGSQKAYCIYFLKRNKTKPSCFPVPLTSGEIPVTGTESNASHMPETSHGGISVADRHADHGEQGECSAVGEL